MICEIQLLFQLISANARKLICPLMFFISNHWGIKCLCNLLQLETHNVMFKVISYIMVHWYDMWNSIVIAFNFCNAKKMISALMFTISNHYGIKYLRNLLQWEPCNVMYKVISDIMEHWYDVWNSIDIAINFSNAMKSFVHWCSSSAIIMEKDVLVIYYSYNHAMLCLKRFLK